MIRVNDFCADSMWEESSSADDVTMDIGTHENKQKMTSRWMISVVMFLLLIFVDIIWLW